MRTHTHIHMYTHTSHSHYICVPESYICEESDFFIFVTAMRTAYDSWLKKARRGKLNALSIVGTLTGALQEVCISIRSACTGAKIISLTFFPQGLGFVDTLYRFCTKHNFNPLVFDPEYKKWVLLLLQLVDVTGDKPHIHLERFLGKSTHGVVKKYRDDIIEYVSTDSLTTSRL